MPRARSTSASFRIFVNRSSQASIDENNFLGCSLRSSRLVFLTLLKVSYYSVIKRQTNGLCFKRLTGSINLPKFDGPSCPPIHSQTDSNDNVHSVPAQPSTEFYFTQSD